MAGRYPWTWVVAFAFLALGGCKAEVPVAPGPKSYENLEKISSAYLAAIDKLDRAPANFEEFKGFLMQYGDPEALMRSPDDNENYVILWGVDYREIQPYPVIMYERNGVNGRRWVVRVQGPFQATDDLFKTLPFPPGYKCPI